MKKAKAVILKLTLNLGKKHYSRHNKIKTLFFHPKGLMYKAFSTIWIQKVDSITKIDFTCGSRYPRS